MSQKERRRYVRFGVPLYARYTLSSDSGEFSGVTKDISMEGMRIVADKDLHVLTDSVMEIHLLIPNKTLKVLGKIIWVNTFPDRKEVGVRFFNIPDAHKEDIYDYISTYHRDEITHHWWDEK